jgi:branched-chain amino acid transport system permease protein
MELLLSVISSGMLNGLVYALVGLAFVLIFRVDKVVNLAIGECTMLGALVGFELHRARGLPLLVAFAGVLVVGASIGAITEVGILRRMRTRDPLRVLILTFGLALVLHSVARLIWSTDLYSLPTFPGVPEVIRLGHQRAVLPGQFVWIAALAVLVFGTWGIVLKRTDLGRDLRAVSDDREIAEAMGIRASRRVLGAYVAGCALAAVAGFFVSPVMFMSYTGGTLLGLKGLVAALVGGFFRPMGAVVGGLVLGLAEAGTSGYYRADLKEVTVFGVLIVLLLVRPQGVLPTRTAT